MFDKCHQYKKTSNMSSQPVGKTCLSYTFSALTLLVGRQEGHLACKKTEWWGAGVVICLEWVADLHMVQLMPVPLTVSCFSKIQIDFTFWYQLTRVIPDKGPLNRCVCLCICFSSAVHESSYIAVKCSKLLLLVVRVCTLLVGWTKGGGRCEED